MIGLGRENGANGIHMYKYTYFDILRAQNVHYVETVYKSTF